MKNDLMQLRVGDVIACSRDDGRKVWWTNVAVEKLGREYLYVTFDGWERHAYRRQDGRARYGRGHSGRGEARTLDHHKYMTEVRDPALAHLREWIAKRPYSWYEQLSASQLLRIVDIINEPTEQ